MNTPVSGQSYTFGEGNFLPTIDALDVKSFVWNVFGKCKYLQPHRTDGKKIGFAVNDKCLIVRAENNELVFYIARAYRKSGSEGGTITNINYIRCDEPHVKKFVEAYPEVIDWLLDPAKNRPPAGFGWNGQKCIGEFRATSAHQIYLASKRAEGQPAANKRRVTAFATFDSEILRTEVDYENGVVSIDSVMKQEIFETISVLSTVGICKHKMFPNMDMRVVTLQAPGLTYNTKRRVLNCKIKLDEFDSNDVMLQVVVPVSVIKSSGTKR